jgi:hypothetical protein
MTATGITGQASVGIDEVTGLQAALDAKLDDPAAISDVTGLQAALDAKLDETAPVVTDSTLTVVRSAGGAARWRSTGGALDIETVGDVIESSRANQDFTGTQTDLRRMRAGSGNTLVGLTEFGSTAYTAGQSINAATGVSYLGAKNSATNLGISGYVDVDGPPISGTWAVNDLVHTRTGVYRCTVAGTPGTWTGGLITGVPQPTDHSLVAWSLDPATVFGATLWPAAGTIKVAKVRAVSPVATNILFHFTLGGGTLSNCFAALYNEAGALLGAGAITADQSTAWQTGGLKTCALSTPQAVTPGALYRVAWWWNGTTAPTASRGSASGSTIINVGQSASTARFATADTGRTNAASVPPNLGSLAGDATAWWVGLS